MRTIAITINKGGVEGDRDEDLATAASTAGFSVVMLDMGLISLRSSKKLLNDRSCWERSAGA